MNIQPKKFYYVSHSTADKVGSHPLTERTLFLKYKDAKAFAYSHKSHCEVYLVDEKENKTHFKSFGNCPHCGSDSLGFTAYAIAEISCSNCYKTIETH